MRVQRVVMHSATSATVYLQPSWLARLFGARDLVCEVERRGARKGHDEEEGPVAWRSKHTGKRLGWMKHGSLIEHALECQPVTGCELPGACIHNPQEWGA